MYSYGGTLIISTMLVDPYFVLVESNDPASRWTCACLAKRFYMWLWRGNKYGFYLRWMLDLKYNVVFLLGTNDNLQGAQEKVLNRWQIFSQILIVFCVFRIEAFCVNFTSFEIEMLFAVVTVTCLDLHVWILMLEEIATDKGDDRSAYTIQALTNPAVKRSAFRNSHSWQRNWMFKLIDCTVFFAQD